MNWPQHLRDALTETYPPPKPWVAALATVDALGRPHVRSVVIRDIADSGRLTFISDGRSEKNHHLRERPLAEVAVWIEARRLQFRIAGEVRLLSAGDRSGERESLWRSISDASRALFVWPAPGQPKDDAGPWPRGVAPEAAMPAHFEVLVLEPAYAERLDLTQHPHWRSKWSRDPQGAERLLNP